VEATATAFPHRGTAFNLSAWAGWIDPSEDSEMIAWAKSLHDATAPHSNGAVYANYLDTDDDDKVQAAFGENHARLQRIKAAYDPDNLFSTNQNLVPKS
jgi:FAD/FMN-containing dehydrogenase